MSYDYDFAVFIGRFQPFHRGHFEVLEKALSQSEKVIMVLGSNNRARSPRNPFTVEERTDIILYSIPSKYDNRVIMTSVPDFMYNDQKWIAAVQSAVYHEVYRKFRAGPTKIALAGMHKDETSYYLNYFPSWNSIAVNPWTDVENTINATDWRHCMFSNVCHVEEFNEHFYLNKSHMKMLAEKLEPIKNALSQEYQFLTDYRREWGSGPFLTTDAIVVQSGYILLIQRKTGQGAGKWALPGGFVNPNETMEQATIRELREETRLKVPDPVLKGSIKKIRWFDAPYRSERARIVTRAALIELKPGPLPKVKGSDDAKEARWWPISQVINMPRDLFEDHWDIIEEMIGI